MKFEYDIVIEATSEKEADQKAKAIKMIAKKLSTKEVAKLADIIENDPIKLALAKNALGV